MKTTIEPTDNLKEKLLLFIINPFASFLYSLQDVKTQSSYIVFFLFCILFGWMFIADFEPEDSFRYKLYFLEFAKNPNTNLGITLQDYLDGDPYTKDIYRFVVYWLAATIGGANYHYLFFIASVVFAFFFLKSMKYVTQSKQFGQNMYMLILLFIFVYSNPIYDINGFRFYTAAWIGVLAMFKVVVDHSYPYFFLLIVLPLVHISMVIMWIVVPLSLLLIKYYKIVEPLLFISFFFSFGISILLQNLETISSYLPANAQQMLWAYSSLEKTPETAEVPMYAIILTYLPTLLMMVMTFLLYRNRSHFGKPTMKVYGFYCSFLMICNWLAAFPSGGRFIALSIPILVYLWVENYDVMKRYNKYYWIVPVCYSYSLLYFFRRLSEATNLIFYFTPLPYQIWYNL